MYLSCPATNRLEFCSWSIVNFLNDLSLDENCVSFVEPEMLPVDVSHQVSCPGVSNFVSNDVCERFIASKKSWSDKSEARVFHSSVGERRREDEKIVLSPNIWAEEGLSRLDEVFCLGKFKSSLVNELFLRPDS